MKNNTSITLSEDTDESLGFDRLLGKSLAMQEIFNTVVKISKTDANIMIFGESGTGKELLARSIHNRSSRNKKPFIPFDCVALPENLVESGLFGYEKGAFTGAETMHQGILEYADNGTLFLDEICELASSLQPKLLRVLQEKEFRRVGGQELIKVDLRIICATNVDPDRAVEKGQFRQDLYYRLNVIPLEVPPLRKRKEDIPLLVNYYLDCLSDSPRRTLAPDVMEALMEYSWPGNVRELRNLVECMLSLAGDSYEINLSDLPQRVKVKLDGKNNSLATTKRLPYLKAKELLLVDFDRSYFANLLEENHGNISKAAERANISRRTLYRMIKKYKL